MLLLSTTEHPVATRWREGVKGRFLIEIPVVHLLDFHLDDTRFDCSRCGTDVPAPRGVPDHLYCPACQAECTCVDCGEVSCLVSAYRDGRCFGCYRDRRQAGLAADPGDASVSTRKDGGDDE